MECWNSLHYDDTPFPKRSKDLVNHSLSVASRTMQPNVYIVARFCFIGPVESRRGPHSRNKGFLQHVADAATISHTWVNTVLKPLDEAMDDETCHPTRAAATMSDAEDDDAETCADGEENSNNPDNSDTGSDRPDWE